MPIQPGLPAFRPITQPPKGAPPPAPPTASFIAKRVLSSASTGFTYAGTPLPNLDAAIAWKPGQKGLTGAAANEVIFKTYDSLDRGMSAYLGSPALPNWMTFGKYAAREAGGQIVRMEEILKAVKNLDLEAGIDMLRDFLSQPARLGEQGNELLKVSKMNPVTAVHNVHLVRDALVIGNTGVYSDLAPPYDLFLRTEAVGGNGVAALREAGWGKAPKDPQGLLLPAFELYQRAAQRKESLSPDARAAMIHRANMLIACHEQMQLVGQPRVFGDREVARVLGSLSSQMTVTDVRGTLELLPSGGNWADFATRMGFDEVVPGTPGAYRVTDWSNRVHHYAPTNNPARKVGTISSYFEGAMNTADAARMIAASPKPLPEVYNDENDLLRVGKRAVSGLVSRWLRVWHGALPGMNVQGALR